MRDTIKMENQISDAAKPVFAIAWAKRSFEDLQKGGKFSEAFVKASLYWAHQDSNIQSRLKQYNVYNFGTNGIWEKTTEHDNTVFNIKTNGIKDSDKVITLNQLITEIKSSQGKNPQES